MVASIVNFEGFVAVMRAANDAYIERFGPAVALCAFAAVVLITIVFLSPLGRIRIGGAQATPLLPRWNLFAITLCTTIATGILFWGAAEPMYHVTDPPAFAGVDGDRDAAARFALSSIFLHWSITPYAIYTVCSLAFALSRYNLGGSFSLSAPLQALIGKRAEGWPSATLDALALFALVAGVCASLSAGVLTLVGGLGKVLGVESSPAVSAGVTALITAAFVASSVSGLQRGIRILSDWNVRVFFLLCGFVFVAGPTLGMLDLGAKSLFDYGREFVSRSLGLNGGLNDPWTRDWASFQFSVWLAWAPITAMFLGRIGVGYSVREFVLFNLVWPAAFSIVWMTVFAGGALITDAQTGGALATALREVGPEAVIYALLDTLPFTGIVIVIFIGATFISFVTAMDSNTEAISNVTLQTDAPDRASLFIKIVWGALIGAVSWIMTATTGVDGIRLLGNLGGAPGLLVLSVSAAVLVRLVVSPARARVERGPSEQAERAPEPA